MDIPVYAGTPWVIYIYIKVENEGGRCFVLGKSEKRSGKSWVDMIKIQCTLHVSMKLPKINKNVIFKRKKSSRIVLVNLRLVLVGVWKT